MTKRLLGGNNQKLAQLKEEEGDTGPSQLAAHLLGLWSWGNMSAPLVQALALSAVKDGLQHPDVVKLSKIGSSGKYPGNMQRDLALLTKGYTDLAEAESVFPIMLKNLKTKLSADVQLKFLLPHKLFACLYHHMPSAFQASVLGGDPANVAKFWVAMKDNPIFTSRPELRGREDLAKLIPIGVHGDGVNYSQVRRAGGKSLDVLSWMSLLARGPTKLTSFLMFMVVKNLIKDHGVGQTWTKVWRILAWSFEALAKGTWPSKNYDNSDFEEGSLDQDKMGTPLAGGYAAFVFVLKADLEFLSNHFNLNSPASNSPCSLCKADRAMEGRPWTDCRLSAAWRASCWGREEWAQEHPDSHPFFKMAGSGIDIVFPDLMHCKHLGSDQLVLGGVLTWLVKKYLKGCWVKSDVRKIPRLPKKEAVRGLAKLSCTPFLLRLSE